MNEDDADKIIERLKKTKEELRIEEITSILVNTSPSQFGDKEIQNLLLELSHLSLRKHSK